MGIFLLKKEICVVTAAIRWLRQTVLQRQLEPALAELTRRLASLTDDAPR